MKFFSIISLLPVAALALPEGLVERATDSLPRDLAETMTPALVSRAEAAATVCGSGYKLQHAVPLPKGTDPDMRLATLFGYENSAGKGCAILDNNAGDPEYMYLKLCNLDKKCGKDSGTFSQYAGPVYIPPHTVCATVTAKMGSTSSNLYIDYESDYLFACN